MHHDRDLDAPDRLRRLRFFKRLFAPLRAGFVASLALLAAGLAREGRPLAVDLCLIMLALYIFVERVSIPPRISGWRSDRRTKGALALAFFASILVAFADRGRGPLLPLPAQTADALLIAGVALVLIGGAIRQWAILTLGKFFTDRARVIDGHQLVQRGPYRLVRHPAYTGLALVFLGFPLALGSVPGVAIALLFAPIALYLRVRVEEELLTEYFGFVWEEYAARTPRLLPWPRPRKTESG